MMDVSHAVQCQKPAPGLSQTSQHRNLCARPQEATALPSCCVVTEKTGVCACAHSPGTQGEALLCGARGLQSLWNGSQEASISLSSFYPFSFYLCVCYFFNLIRRHGLAEDFINSIPITGNIQKTDRCAPEEICHSHHLALTGEFNFIPVA